MSFNSGEFNAAIKCASVKRFHLYIRAAPPPPLSVQEEKKKC